MRGAVWSGRIAVGLAVVGLTGCGGGGGGDAPGGAEARPVVIALGAEPENFNPVFGDIFGTFYGDKWPMFNGLLRRNAELELEPDLAAAPPEVSEDGRTVTVGLREGVRFHDGEPFTAEDVVFTYEAILDPEVATSLRDLLVDTLAEVEAVDPATVRFTLKRVDPSFLDTLEFGIVPEHLLEGEDLNTTAFNTTRPVGTGPFKFDEFRKGDRIVMSANPDYFGGQPAIPRLVWAIVPDENQRATLMAQGDTDVEVSSLSPRIAARFADDPDVRLESIPGDANAIVLPNDNPVLREARVRRALGLAIDRQALVDGVFQGSAEPVNGPLMPGHWAYDPELEVPFDQARARSELDAAGWKLRGDTREKDGRALRFKLVYIAGDPAGRGVALAVRSDLAEVGVEVDLQGLGFDAFSEELGKGAAIVNDQATVFDPELDWPELYTSEFASDDDDFSNGAKMRVPAIDAAVAGAGSTLERSERIPDYQQAQREIVENGGWIYLVRRIKQFPVARDLQLDSLPQEGHVHGFSRAMLANVADWSLE
jgi:peptide/nickel transport system substrate-binding protein